MKGKNGSVGFGVLGVKDWRSVSLQKSRNGGRTEVLSDLKKT